MHMIGQLARALAWNLGAKRQTSTDVMDRRGTAVTNPCLILVLMSIDECVSLSLRAHAPVPTRRRRAGKERAPCPSWSSKYCPLIQGQHRRNKALNADACRYTALSDRSIAVLMRYSLPANGLAKASA